MPFVAAIVPGGALAASDLSDLSDFSDLRTEQSQFLLALDAQLRKYPANNDSI
jgi:hypothetical protein